MKIIMEAKKGLGQRDVKGPTKYYFVFDGWCDPKRFYKALMYVVAEMVFVVLKNREVLCKGNIENLTKDWPGGYNLMLKRKAEVPRNRSIIDIGYNYNKRKSISFIDTE